MATSLERLKPQLSQSAMDAHTWLNYEKAQKFYELRYNAWERYMEINLQQENLNLITYLTNVLTDDQNGWAKISSSFWKEFYTMTNSKQHFTDYINNISQEKFNENIGLDLLRQWVLTKPRKPVAAFLGDRFETYVTNVMQSFGKTMGVAGQQLADNLLTEYFKQTGAMRSTGATVKDAQNIRPDIIVGNITYDIQNNGAPSQKVLTGNGVAIELQGKVDLDSQTAIDQLKQLAEIYNTANLFGFSVKVWSDSNRKEFSSSSIIRNELQNIFFERDAKGSRHAWDKDYVTTFVLYHLSTWIVNIIGPTNIGLVTGKDFVSFSDWLKDKHVFYMNVQMKNVRAKDKTKGLPQVAEKAKGQTDDGIYILNYSHESQKLATSLRKSYSKNRANNFYNISFTVKNNSK